MALTRVAWHLGNRHLPTEILPKALRIRRDPVIEAMAEGLGARVIALEAPFNPEGGAYVKGDGTAAEGHGHGHAHDLDHAHGHAHADAHDPHHEHGPEHGHGPRG
jgi:urease accessory protein